MLINPLTGLFSSASQSLQKTGANIKTTIADLVSGSRGTDAFGGDVADLSSAVQLQNSLAGLRQVNVNVAQNLSLTQVASDGVEQVQQTLARLKEIATRANSGDLDENARKGLNKEFQSLLSDIDKTAQGVRFGGSSLLDGSLSGSGALSFKNILGDDAQDAQQLSIEPVSKEALLGSRPLDVLSQANAEAALTQIEKGIDSLSSLQADIGAFQENLGFAGAVVASATFNQEAARASLSDADIAAASTANAQNLLQQNISQALVAQGNRLAPSMVELIN